MTVSRRTLLSSALAGTALDAVGGTELTSAFTASANAASPGRDVVGGYQPPRERYGALEHGDRGSLTGR